MGGGHYCEGCVVLSAVEGEGRGCEAVTKKGIKGCARAARKRIGDKYLCNQHVPVQLACSAEACECVMV